MSSLEQYTALVQQFCAHAGIADAAALLDGAVVAVDGINLKLAYSTDVNPEVLFLYCEYGEVPRERAAEVYEMLLRWNALVTVGVSPCYAMSPSNRTLIYIHPMVVSNTSPEQLLEAVRATAGAAKSWRESNYFLDAPALPEELWHPATRSGGASAGAVRL